LEIEVLGEVIFIFVFRFGTKQYNRVTGSEIPIELS